MLCAGLLVVLAAAVLGAAAYMEARFGLRHDAVVGELGSASGPAAPEYSMRMNTFRRNDMLRLSLEHYSLCPGLREIVIVWSDQERRPPDTSGWRISRAGPRVVFEEHREDRLTNRFRPLAAPATDAVFSIDDDLIIPCETMALGFAAWRQSPRTMVGFSARMHSRDPATGAWGYRSWWYTYWNGAYSLVLSKCAFVHRSYMEAFWQLPAELTEEVDRQRNCEDLLLSFLVAHRSGLPALWVAGTAVDKGDGGISAGSSHFDLRSACVDRFARHFGGMPLQVTSAKVVDARRQWFWGR